MNKQKRSWLWAAVVLLLLLSLAWGCGPTATPTPEPTEPPEVIETIEPTETPDFPALCEEETRAGRQHQEEVPQGLELSPYKDHMYVAGQVVLSGPPEGIARVLDELPFVLEPFETKPLELGGGNVAELYTIPEERSVEEVVCQISKWAARLEVAVAGDPNYYLSPAGEWAGVASPWTQNGPWARQDPVINLQGGGLAPAPSGDFTLQWALGVDSGIGLYDQNGARIPVEDGAGIRIGIFDTSPFAGVGAQDSLSSHELTEQAVQLSEAHESFKPTISQPALIPAPGCPGKDAYTGNTLEGQDISNHGLFVAGLVHAVAPASEIHLVRVLEPDGCGTLFSIAQGIQDFVDKAMQDLESERIRGVVLNLSLGVHHPRDPESFALPARVASLETFLENVVGRLGPEHVVIVAAAGNDSYGEPRDAPRGMELPAAYDFVVGVTASNAEGQRGCFSNFDPDSPNVAAPGGDGVHPLDEDDVEWYCHLPDCTKDPEDCLISLSRWSESGYAYWVGTSFAAPLVTGQVALNFGSTPLTATCAWPDSDLPGTIHLPAACPPPAVPGP